MSFSGILVAVIKFLFGYFFYFYISVINASVLWHCCRVTEGIQPVKKIFEPFTGPGVTCGDAWKNISVCYGLLR